MTEIPVQRPENGASVLFDGLPQFVAAGRIPVARRGILRRVLRSRIVGNAGVMAGGMALRLLLQLGSFTLVARTLSSSAYGEFASIVAIAVIMSAFAGWGGDQMLIRAVAHDRAAFRSAYGNALAYLAISGPVVSFLAVALVAALVGWRSSVAAVWLIILSDVLFAKVNVLAAASFQSHELGGRTALLNVSLSAARLLAVLLWMRLPVGHTAESWSWFYAGSSGLVAAASLLLVNKRLGRPCWNIDQSFLKTGFYFSVQLASFNAFRDVEKPILASLTSLEAAGLYAAAYRVIDASLVPVRSLMFAAYVRFFQHGSSGPRGSLSFALKLLPAALGLGIIASLALVVAAPYLPLLIGRSYAGSERIVYILALLPILYALYYVAADSLVSSGYVGARTAIQSAVLLLQAGLCSFVAADYGAIGVAFASVGVHIVLALASWIAAIAVARRSPAG